ncbi:hypothetical protein AAVH_36138, partial [Aphelenchoides avenae]
KNATLFGQCGFETLRLRCCVPRARSTSIRRNDCRRAACSLPQRPSCRSAHQ